jgi:plastocyanin
MRFHVAAGCTSVMLVVSFLGCGGGGGNPGGPSGQPPATGPSTISIVGDRANQSFAPNPGAGGVDQAVVWRNNDSVTHRIVVNDTQLDTGDIAPGATSRTLLIPAGGANYHCTIHPGMVGAVTASGGQPPPPCTGVYC